MLYEGAFASFLNSAMGFSTTLFLRLPRLYILSLTTMIFFQMIEKSNYLNLK